MQTQLTGREGLPEDRAAVADAVLRRCVHCGFCNATCPTYAVTGNELDGPRGRIYLIKQALETGEATRITQRHLDRCLTCMACETTCPSGVEYHRLLDVGREFVDARVRRPLPEALLRRLLRTVITRRWLFEPLVGIARRVRWLLPPELQARVPAAPATGDGNPRRPGAQPAPPQAVMLAGCVEPALTPATHAAARRVLAAHGIDLQTITGGGCCGALHFHFGDRERALMLVRRNVRALARVLDTGATHVASTASGCGAFIREYGDLLADDEKFAGAARRVSAAHRDVSQLLDVQRLKQLTRTPAAGASDEQDAAGGPGTRTQRNARPEPADEAPVAVFHCPCTLQHAQGLSARVPEVLAAAGVPLLAAPGPFRCCGSAGAYSVLQPTMADTLGRWRADQLERSGAERVLTANVGCQHHLDRFSNLPVQHWLEAVAERLETPDT